VAISLIGGSATSQRWIDDRHMTGCELIVAEWPAALPGRRTETVMAEAIAHLKQR